MNRKALIVATLGGLCMPIPAIAVVNFVGGANNHTSFALQTPAAYSCGSIHFGMDDNTLTGTASLGASSIGNNGDSIGTLNNVSMTSYSVTKVIDGKGKEVYPVYSNGNGLKFGKSGADGEITITLSQSFTVCHVYAVGWKGDSAKLSVNSSDEVSVASDNKVTGSSDVSNVPYTKYTFELSETNVLTISATKRLIIGDIALRISA